MNASRATGETVPEAMLMILPDFWARIAGRTARQQKNKPRRFTAIKRSHSSGSMVSMRPRFIGTTEKTAASYQNIDAPETLDGFAGHRLGGVFPDTST